MKEMDPLTTILAGIAGYFALAWKAEKDKADSKSAKRLERIEKFCRAAGKKMKIPFDDSTEDNE